MIEDKARGKTLAKTTTQTGSEAESVAADYLISRGMRIIARNVRCRGGEVDLIAAHGAVVVFVEVRMRRNTRFGGAAESITATKQRRVIMAAQFWLMGAGKRYGDRPCRFDAILISSLAPLQLDWVENAFTADY